MLNILNRLLGKSKSQKPNQTDDVKYLIVGLGNIGPDYENTRHNIGFMVLDHIAREKNVSFEPARYGDKATFRFKGRTFILIKPNTYMNLSGKAIHYWLTKEKISIEKLMVIVDDVALPLGTIRLKAKGSDGGHNGLASIISVLGTNLFPRLRFGIGDDFPKGAQVHYVLGKWEPWELEIIDPVIKKCGDLIISFATIGIERTMNFFNTKTKAARKNQSEDNISDKPSENV
jgi:PTH1 family peptidyl-tRNA hydrolase